MEGRGGSEDSRGREKERRRGRDGDAWGKRDLGFS